MSIYDFYPMKKRRLCKTPNGGRSCSTLGKLKKTSEQVNTAKESGIEIVWDNNSPSPTTTLALAGKRRRRQNNHGDPDGNNETTDISFVVEKLSENTSPVVDNTHSALLEMWVSKEQSCSNGDEEFTSPPNQTRHEKRKAVLFTPLNQRRTSKRTTRKAARQFMLEIRKLVDEIQKSDISNSGNPTQRDVESANEQEQPPKRKSSRGTISSTVTNAKPRTMLKHQTCDSIASVTGDTDSLPQDSFEWTEDDMDDVILTCQLSSSGKGSLDVPDLPRPRFGFSPSITQVPETQMLSRDPGATRNSRGKYGMPSRQSHEAIVELDDDNWELNFAEDDSLLESAAQEFELSQEMPKPNGITLGEDTGKCISGETTCTVDLVSKSVTAAPSPSDRLVQKLNSNSLLKRHETGPKVSSRVVLPKVLSVAECQRRAKEMNTPSCKPSNHLHSNKMGKSLNGFSEKSDENHHSSFERLSNCRANSTVVLPLSSRPGNSKNTAQKLEIKPRKNGNELLTLRKKLSPNKRLTAKHHFCADKNTNLKSVLSHDTNEFPDEVEESLLFTDNFAALLEDFNFEESFKKDTVHGPQLSADKTCKSGSNKDRFTTTSSNAKKALYTKDEIERKRLEAQRRRLAKLQTTSYTRHSKVS